MRAKHLMIGVFLSVTIASTNAHAELSLSKIGPNIRSANALRGAKRMAAKARDKLKFPGKDGDTHTLVTVDMPNGNKRSLVLQLGQTSYGTTKDKLTFVDVNARGRVVERGKVKSGLFKPKFELPGYDGKQIAELVAEKLPLVAKAAQRRAVKDAPLIASHFASSIGAMEQAATELGVDLSTLRQATRRQGKSDTLSTLEIPGYGTVKLQLASGFEADHGLKWTFDRVPFSGEGGLNTYEHYTITEKAKVFDDRVADRLADEGVARDGGFGEVGSSMYKKFVTSTKWLGNELAQHGVTTADLEKLVENGRKSLKSTVKEMGNKKGVDETLHRIHRDDSKTSGNIWDDQLG